MSRTKRNRSPALADPSNFQKQNITCSCALGKELELERLTKENEILRAKLSLTAAAQATVTQYHKARNEIQEILEKEKTLMKFQSQLNQQTIDQLQEDLETLVRNNCDAREAEVTAEMKYSKLKEEFREFMIKVQRELNFVSAKMLELEGKLVESQKIDSDWIQLDGKQVLRLIPVGLQSLLNYIPNLHAVEKEKQLLEDEIFEIQRRLDEEEEQGVMSTSENCEELSLGCHHASEVMEYETSRDQQEDPLQENEELSSRVDDFEEDHQKTSAERTETNDEDLNLSLNDDKVPEDDEDPLVLDDSSSSKSYIDISSSEEEESPSVIQSNELRDPERENLRILVAKNLFVLASDPLFFKINWGSTFTCEKRYKWVCNKCKWVGKTRMNIQDHVFVEHFNGAFQCEKCPNTFKWRGWAALHHKRSHC